MKKQEQAKAQVESTPIATSLTRNELLVLLAEAAECIEVLAGQQAMPDDFYKEPLTKIQNALKNA